MIGGPKFQACTGGKNTCVCLEQHLDIPQAHCSPLKKKKRDPSVIFLSSMDLLQASACSFDLPLSFLALIENVSLQKLKLFRGTLSILKPESEQPPQRSITSLHHNISLSHLFQMFYPLAFPCGTCYNLSKRTQFRDTGQVEKQRANF